MLEKHSNLYVYVQTYWRMGDHSVSHKQMGLCCQFRSVYSASAPQFLRNTKPSARAWFEYVESRSGVREFVGRIWDGF